MKRLTPAPLLLALFLAGGASGTTLTRHPSLWRVTTNSILIAWQTDVPSPGKVLYGTTPGLGSEAADAAIGTVHSVTLTGLAPATRYFYKVVANAESLTAGDDTLLVALYRPDS